MAMPMRVTGGWIQLLTDWLDLYQFPAPDLRLLLDSRRQDEAVPLALWQQLLERASMLPATAVVPALEIGAQVRPRHVGVLGYLSLASHTLGEALQVYQRYEQLFPGDKATSALNRQFQGRLARLGGGTDGGGAAFFPLLAPVAKVLKEMKVEPKRLQYDQRQNVLLVDVGAKDYAQLEALQNAIRKQGGNASIANYRNGAQGVSARIKVEQPG